MSYNCTCYINTGFNPVNIPDNETTLQSNATAVTLPALVILQERFLTNVRVKTDWDTIKNADYCKVGDFYYFVTGVRMTSSDVAEISLVPDFITSAGGATSLSFLDGLTVRHHVTDDTFGAYVEQDPYMCPSQPLEIVTAGWIGDDDSEKSDVTLMVTPLNLGAMGAEGYNPVSLTFTDSAGNSVTVPKAEYTGQSSNYSIPGGNKTAFVGGMGTYIVDGNVARGANVARSLGVESAITAQYAVPGKYIDYTTNDNSALTSIQGTSGNFDSALSYQYATVRNLRVLYGELNKFGIITASGNRAEFNPEDVRGNDSTFQIQYITDPRETGKPFFAPKQYHGNANIWSCNPIGGADWRDVPLVYTKQSGSIQNAYNFESEQALARSQYNESNAARVFGFANRALNRVTGTASQAANTVNSPGAILNPVGTAASVGMGVAMSAIQTGMDVAQTAVEQNYADQQYNIARERELYNFGVSQNVVIPSINFPYQDTTLRDYMGNNVFVYRYRLSDSDVTKIDKILSMYGYRDTAPITNAMMSSKQYFNYVQANGVSVAGNYPQWWKSGIAAQFSAGVRIWHVKPDASYYTLQ